MLDIDGMQSGNNGKIDWVKFVPGLEDGLVQGTQEFLAARPDLAESFLRQNYDNVSDFLKKDGKIKLDKLASAIERDGKIGKLIMEWFKHDFLGANFIRTFGVAMKPREDWDTFLSEFENAPYASVEGKNVVFHHPSGGTVATISRAMAEGHALLHMSYPEGVDVVIPQSADAPGFGFTKNFIAEYRSLVESQNPPGEVLVLSPHQVKGPPEKGQVRFVVFDESMTKPEDRNGLEHIFNRGGIWPSNEAFALALVQTGTSPEEALGKAQISSPSQSFREALTQVQADIAAAAAAPSLTAQAEPSEPDQVAPAGESDAEAPEEVEATEYDFEPGTSPLDPAKATELVPEGYGVLLDPEAEDAEEASEEADASNEGNQS